jgi:hypothetical protein
MKVSAQKLAALFKQPVSFPDPGECFRKQEVFFLGDHLPLQQTLEVLFASDCESPAELFHFTFSKASSFAASLPLAHQIQKNFKGYRMGRFLYSPPVEHIDAAYAAGLELIDLPFYAAASQNEEDGYRTSLQHARTLFARWTVVTSLYLQGTPWAANRSRIDELLGSGVLPILQMPTAAAGQAEEYLSHFQLLSQQWRRSKANLKPILPLLLLCTPFLAEPPRKGVDRLLEVANAASQRAAADLRRLLRVRGVEQSFDSAAL